jgi:hypothetical protein
VRKRTLLRKKRVFLFLLSRIKCQRRGRKGGLKKLGVAGKTRVKTSRGKKAARGVPWSRSGCENERATRYLPTTVGHTRDFRPVRRCSRYPGDERFDCVMGECVI